MPTAACPRLYDRERSAPSTLPKACAAHCPIAQGETIPEQWLSAKAATRKGAVLERLGYTSLTGAAKRGTLFRNPLHVEFGWRGRVHAANYPLCALVAFDRWSQARRERGKARRERKAEGHKAREWARLQKCQHRRGETFGTARVEVVAELSAHPGTKSATLAYVLGISRQRVHQIRHQMGL